MKEFYGLKCQIPQYLIFMYFRFWNFYAIFLEKVEKKSSFCDLSLALMEGTKEPPSPSSVFFCVFEMFYSKMFSLRITCGIRCKAGHIPKLW